MAAGLLSKIESALPETLGKRWRGHGGAEQISWFIKLRWLACFGIGASILISQNMLGLLPGEVTLPLWAGVLGLAGFNAFCVFDRKTLRPMRNRIIIQIGADVVLTGYLLHFSGGLENPLFVVLVFHAILASILLEPADAFLAAGFIILVLAFVGVCEYLRVVEHFTLKLFPHFGGGHGGHNGGGTMHAAHSAGFLVSILGAFAFLIGGTTVFTSSIMARFRRNHERMIRAEKLGALGEILSYIAHEVNNPVGIISTRIKLVLSGEAQYSTPAFVRESAEIIDRNADRVGRIVDTLLTLARKSKSGKPGADLSRAVDEALSVAAGFIYDAGIRTVVELPGDLPPVAMPHGDAVQVILNLVKNAADAMPGGGKLAIRAVREGRSVSLIVADSGPGIPAADLDEIWAPFFTTKGTGRGTGLGLSIARSLASFANGSLSAGNAPEGGAVFTLRVPAAVKDADG